MPKNNAKNVAKLSILVVVAYSISAITYPQIAFFANSEQIWANA